MDPLLYVLQTTTMPPRPGPGPGFHPGFGFGIPLVGTILSIVLVAAAVYLAWKIGAYYDAARKKLKA